MRYHDPASRRDGFALPVALLAIIVIGAIVTGGFYAASQESRIATSTDLGNQAFYLAEYGLAETLGTWKNSDLRDRFEGSSVFEDTATTEAVALSGGAAGQYTIVVRYLAPTMFLVSSEGTVTAGPRSARRKVGTIVRTLNPVMPATTALAVYGGLTVGGNSYIRGNDECVGSDTVAGVTAYDSSLVANQNRDHISGDPPLDEDAALDTAALSDFGALTLQDLIGAATKVYEPGGSENGMGPATTTDADGNTVCDTSEPSNWGAPTDTTHVCANEFPIIHAQGDFSLQTGSGQGILIVEGDLTATGNFDFYGVVIVMGELRTTGTGNHLEGSVVVQGDGLLDSESTTLGNSLVQYNQCTTERAFNATLRPRPLASRSWLDFTAITRGEALDS